MKRIKTLGLFAAAAAAMTAFAASASATTITDSAGSSTPTIHAVNENGHIVTHNGLSNVECSSTMEFTIQSHGTGVTAQGPLSQLIINNCTNDWQVHVITAGSLEIHYTGAGSGHGVGTLTSSGMTVTKTRFGLQCTYLTNNTKLGTITGGNPGTIHLEGLIPRHGGSFLCGGPSHSATGEYVTTNTLKIDP